MEDEIVFTAIFIAIIPAVVAYLAIRVKPNFIPLALIVNCGWLGTMVWFTAINTGLFYYWGVLATIVIMILNGMAIQRWLKWQGYLQPRV